MSQRISRNSVISLVIAAGILVVSIFVPWWRMEFYAPQYRDGLDIIVYPYQLVGDIDVVNSLNHYIGMAQFSEETFPELQFMPYIIGAMALLTILVAVIGRKKFIYGLLGLFMVGGVYGIYHLHNWLVEFGTNLDPQAPIDMEPFVPPMYGENVIANFVTYSYFSYGSLLLVIAFLCMAYPIWKDRKR